MNDFTWIPESSDGSRWAYTNVQPSIEYGFTYTFYGSIEKIPDGAYEAESFRNNVCQIFPSMKEASDYVYWEARV